MANDIKYQEAISIPYQGEKGTPTLKIHTAGERGQVYTRASVHFDQPSDGVFSSSVHRMFTDYSERLIVERKRATAKALETQHAAVMQDLDTIRAQAIAHYS